MISVGEYLGGYRALVVVEVVEGKDPGDQILVGGRCGGLL